MKQPTKDALREQLALAADEIIRLSQEAEAFHESDSWTLGFNTGYNAARRYRWWHRFAWWRA